MVERAAGPVRRAPPGAGGLPALRTAHSALFEGAE
jgi:hypothetical protein